MSKNLRENYHTLVVISQAKPKLRNAILLKADNRLIKALSEIIFNILNGKVDLSLTHVKKLRKKRKALYKLAKKSVPVKEKRKLLVQTGGLLPGIIVPALSLLISLLT